MLLGDLLARFTDEAVAAEAILQIGNLALAVKMQDEAEAEGVTLGAYAAAAVRRYAAEASEEEWVTLMGALQRATDPGGVCLQRAFAHGLKQSR